VILGFLRKFRRAEEWILVVTQTKILFDYENKTFFIFIFHNSFCNPILFHLFFMSLSQPTISLTSDGGGEKAKQTKNPLKRIYSTRGLQDKENSSPISPLLNNNFKHPAKPPSVFNSNLTLIFNIFEFVCVLFLCCVCLIVQNRKNFGFTC